MDDLSLIRFVISVYVLTFLVSLLVAFLILLIRKLIVSKEDEKEVVMAAAVAAYLAEEEGMKQPLRVKERNHEGEVGFW